MNFSDTELMMLEQLTYLNDACKIGGVSAKQVEGEKIGSRLAVFDETVLRKMEGTGDEGQQWAAMIRYIKGNEEMSNLVQGKQFLQDGTNLGNAYYYEGNETDAIVTFKGTTTAKNWYDNGVGLGATDTPVQEDAFNYIESLPYGNITVVGHSKGGNLAQYTTIRSNKVTKCVSMDGQGFSNEFLNKYAPQIAQKGHLITNYSLSTDFVHILLKPIPNSKQVYCAGSRVDGIAQNHFANSFFQFHTVDGTDQTILVMDGNGPVIVETSENEMMTYLKKFTWFIVDTMPQDERVEMGEFVGNILQMAMENATVNGFTGPEDLLAYMLSEPEQLGRLIAYLIKYVDNENLTEAEFQGLVSMLGLGEIWGTLLSVVDLSAIENELSDGKRDYLIEGALELLGPEYADLWREIENSYMNIPEKPSSGSSSSSGNSTNGSGNAGGNLFWTNVIRRIIGKLVAFLRSATNITRDFSEASKQKMLGLVTQVENEKWGDFTDWVGDRWYDFESWIGSLNIRNYINNVNTYHKKVIDKNNATEQTINRIFEAVWGVDSSYATTLGNVRSSLEQWLRFVDTMAGIVEPGKGRFNGQYMSSALNPILKDVSKANVQQIKDTLVQNVSGEPVFDEELLLEYIKKDPSKMTDEEKQAVLEVIADLEDTVAFYETAWSVGNDNMSAAFLNRAAWVSDTNKFASFSAVSAHYNEMYVKVLEACLEQGADSNTFAASLLKICNGEDALTVLGLDCSADVSKIFGSASLAAYVAQWKTEHSEEYFAKLEFSEKNSGELLNDIKQVSDIKKAGNQWLEDNGLRQDEKITKFYDENGNEISEKDAGFYDRDYTIAEIDATASVSASIYEGKFDVGEKGEINVVVGNAEAHAGISAGLYVIGANGEKQFMPGVNAEVGASVTAFEADWEQQWLGDENLGLNTEVGVTAGKVGGKGELNAQLFSEDGKLDVQLNAEAKLEAIAVEAEGSVGVNVLGGEIEASAGVNIGIGAHAEVGYKDGKFKFDVGASLGVGVSVDVEIDVGGMVDTVVDGAQAVWDGIKDGWNKLWDW